MPLLGLSLPLYDFLYTCFLLILVGHRDLKVIVTSTTRTRFFDRHASHCKGHSASCFLRVRDELPVIAKMKLVEKWWIREVPERHLTCFSNRNLHPCVHRQKTVSNRVRMRPLILNTRLFHVPQSLPYGGEQRHERTE